MKRVYRRSIILFLAISPSLIVTIAWFVHRWAKLDSSLAYFLGAVGNLFALTGISFLIIMLTTGVKLPVVEKTFGLDRLMRFHIISGPVVAGLFVSHGVLRFIKSAMLSPDGIDWSFMFYLNQGQTGLNLGKIALLGLLMGAGCAKLGKYFLPYKIWKPAHYILYAAIPAGFIHARIKGDDIVEFPYNIIWTLLAVSFTAIVFYRGYYLVSRNKKFTRYISKIKPETHDTKTFYLEKKHGEESLESGLPGQFAVIRVRHGNRWGEPRPFTISSAPGEDCFSLTIKKTGRFTSLLHSLHKNTQVLFEGPYGIFSPDFEQEKKLFLIAGGVGITPFLSMLRHINQTKEDCDITLLWSLKTRDDIIAGDELEKISEALNGKLKIVIIITREDSPEAGEKSEDHHSDNIVYEYGHMNQKIIGRYINSIDSSVYLCGPQAMQRFILKTLKKYPGIKPASVKRERFFW